MTNPFKELASVMDSRSKQNFKSLLSGVPCELGTITASGIKLDGFKHEYQEYLIADWTFKIELPQASRVIKTAKPVNPDGTDIPNTTEYSALTRLDFNVEGAGGADVTVKAHLDFKSELKPGDRVLAIPINNGQDVVVICKVVNSNA